MTWAPMGKAFETRRCSQVRRRRWRVASVSAIRGDGRSGSGGRMSSTSTSTSRQVRRQGVPERLKCADCYRGRAVDCRAGTTGFIRKDKRF